MYASSYLKDRHINVEMEKYLRRHDLVFKTPMDRESDGIPIGTGCFGGLSYVKEDAVHFCINHIDAVDCARESDFSTWAWEDEEKTTAAFGCGHLTITDNQPSYDWKYLKDFEYRLNLGESVAELKSTTPFADNRITTFASVDHQVMVISGSFHSEDETTREITLSRWGSRNFFHYYEQISDCPEKNLSDTMTSWKDDCFYVSQTVGKNAFVTAVKVQTEDYSIVKVNDRTIKCVLPPKKDVNFRLLVTCVVSGNQTPNVEKALQQVHEAAALGDRIFEEHRADWKKYWNQSFIHLDDHDYLENIYYMSLYFLRCSGLGVNVCTRPDGIVFYFGHNSIWDIRVAEDHKEKLGTFEEIWKKILATPGDIHNEAWYQQYVEDVTSSYHNYVYPRPYPASCMMLFFDRKEYEVLGHELDISTGLLTVTLENTCGQRCYIQVFVSQTEDAVYCRTVDEEGKETPLLKTLLLIPHKSDDGVPEYEPLPNGFLQRLPISRKVPAPEIEGDRGFSVQYRINGSTEPAGFETPLSGMTQAVVQIRQGAYQDIRDRKDMTAPGWDRAWNQAQESWKDYWSRSGVRLDDEFLEHIWYINSYFIRCVLNRDSKCPGLFANWMYDNIGIVWHGDYHMNYNTQQVFWGLMASNRLEQHMPYVRLAEDLIPLSKSWAKDFYGLRGACYPHSAYPVPMTTMSYPSPDWGWEIFETPWKQAQAADGTVYTGEIIEKTMAAGEELQEKG